MELVKLTQNEIENFSKKVGDIEQLKSDIMRTNSQIAHFDLYKDIDSRDRDVYVALKHRPYDNYDFSGFTLY